MLKLNCLASCYLWTEEVLGAISVMFNDAVVLAETIICWLLLLLRRILANAEKLAGKHWVLLWACIRPSFLSTSLEELFWCLLRCLRQMLENIVARSGTIILISGFSRLHFRAQDRRMTSEAGVCDLVIHTVHDDISLLVLVSILHQTDIEVADARNLLLLAIIDSC